MSYTVKVKLKPTEQILKAHGLNRDGYIQCQWTNIVNRRITRYMPYQSGMLATKLKFQSGPHEITVVGPYARYLNEGKRMVNAITGKGPSLIPEIGYRYKKGTVLRATQDPLHYDTAFHALAGSHWAERLVQNEMDEMTAELQNLVKHYRGV